MTLVKLSGDQVPISSYRNVAMGVTGMNSHILLILLSGTPRNAARELSVLTVDIPSKSHDKRCLLDAMRTSFLASRECIPQTVAAVLRVPTKDMKEVDNGGISEKQ